MLSWACIILITVWGASYVAHALRIKSIPRRGTKA
jgi:hypothetical protein